MDVLQKISVVSKVLACHIFGWRIPIACHYSITNRCPWSCQYCGFRNKDKSECDTGQSLEIVRALARNGNVRLHLTGGEPAIREDIGLVIEEAKRLGLFVTIATTGYRLPSIWEKLKDLDIFFLSFDGPREIHDAQRGKGAFDTLFTAIDFLRSKKKEFWTTTVLTRKNIPHIDYMLDTARKMSFKANFHLLYFTGTDSYLDKSMHLSSSDMEHTAQEEYRKALEYLLRRKRTDMKDVIAHSESYLGSLCEWEDYGSVYQKKRSEYYRCWAGKMYCYIDANGDLYPCGDIMGSVEPRNILKMGFREAFRALPPPPCQSCIIACYSELNMMFSLRPEAILNWVGRV